ncbi:hypothetical protein PBI_GRAYSON_269 [Rhodococcus phage Grayson]|nr:hypothetical protein PBI_GRAYSON_269 [Rhodococcus phage Grayson]
MSNIRTDNMYLVYVDNNGQEHHQPWQDVVQSGSLIDPETGDDMDIVGWATDTMESE